MKYFYNYHVRCYIQRVSFYFSQPFNQVLTITVRLDVSIRGGEVELRKIRRKVHPPRYSPKTPSSTTRWLHVKVALAHVNRALAVSSRRFISRIRNCHYSCQYERPQPRSGFNRDLSDRCTLDVFPKPEPIPHDALGELDER